MGSFSCQFIDTEKGYCIRLKKDCIPGRTGCVLKGRFVFAVSAEERIKKSESDKEISTKKYPFNRRKK
ncbi:hypothetical protein ABRY23_13210 [Melioribacteraceae bacterium 4301-Me]|uniref:hypothetical protein n=1 Tax=Pyranulibacter aquaticus TaxID=3163344 RepID=UPI003597B1D2